MDVVLTFVFGVFTPSFDIYSDLALIIKLANYDAKFAFTLACPMILSTIFILPHWWQLEQTMYKKIYTFPLVILQFYYQYKMMQILYLGIYKKTKQWKEQKDTLIKDVSSIGKSFIIKISSITKNVVEYFLLLFALSVPIFIRQKLTNFSNLKGSLLHLIQSLGHSTDCV